MKDRTFLLAGGNSGVGRELLSRLQASGASVVCAGRTLDSLRDQPGVTIIDFDATADRLPDWELPEVLDGFVYLPGTINLKPFSNLRPEDFEHDFQINVMGAVRLLQRALPSLKRADSASLVFFSTVAVQTGLSYHTSVAAAKGAVEGLTRSLAAELAPRIRVNCIAPGLTDTPLAAHLLDTEQKQEAARSRTPLRRIGQPSNTAALLEFLLTSHSEFMTGQILPLDGGLSAVRPL